MTKVKAKNNYKHLKNFVGTPSRPVLSGFHYREDSTIEATNSHIALRLFKAFDGSFEAVLDPKTLGTIDGKYPDLNRLYSSTWDTKFSLSQVDAKALYDYSKNFLEKDAIVKVEVANSVTFYERGNEKNQLTLGKTEVEGESLTLHVSRHYLQIISDFLKDNIPEDRNAQCYLTSSVRPMRICIADTFDLLLTPVRVV